MIKMFVNMKKVLWVFAFFGINVALQGCSSTPLTPSQTAEIFWDAILKQETDTANKYATTQSVEVIGKAVADFQNSSVALEKVNLQNNQASIETLLNLDKEGQEEKVQFTTFLIREKEQWLVNFVDTIDSYNEAKQKKGLSKIVDDLKKFGKNFSGELGEAVKGLEEAGPKLKEDLEDLGESVQKELQDSIDKYGPEIQKNLHEFADSLDEAIKELEKERPQEEKEDSAEQPKGRLI